MNLHDLCADGREKWAAYVDYFIANDSRARILADQELIDHLENCELCTPMEDRDE